MPDPTSPSSCSVCDTPLSPNGRCPRCGAVHGEQHRCPHCGSIAGVERARTLRFRCRVCGGPRVPVGDRSAPLPSSGVEALLRARVAARRAFAWTIGSVATLAAGVAWLSVLLGVLLIVQPALLWWIFGLVSALPLLAAGVWARRRAKQAGSAREAALDAAWQQAAAAILRTSAQEVSAAELGATMALSEHEAELLLARLALEHDVQRRVTDDGELVYSQRGSTLALRVPEEPPSTVRAEDAGAAAELEELGADETEQGIKRGLH